MPAQRCSAGSGGAYSGWRVMQIAQLALLLSHCQFNARPAGSTQLVLEIDAEASVRTGTRRVEVHVSSWPRGQSIDAAQPLTESEFTPQEADWPLQMMVSPGEGELTHLVLFDAIARDEHNVVQVEARLITVFSPNEMRHVQLFLNENCRGVRCEPTKTCSDGTCMDAQNLTSSLPNFTKTDPTATPDAAAMPSSDAAMSDATPPQVDSGTCTHACDPLVACQIIGGKPTCGDCPAGYRDVNRDGSACVDIDECQIDRGDCDEKHSLCTNTPGGHECQCTDGYHGDGKICTANITCQSTVDCGEHASCELREGNRVCVCGAGYEGDGSACLDVDECARKLDHCRAHARCENQPGSFSCPCSLGYTEHGSDCVDIDECKVDNACDDEPSACVNNAGSYMCECPKGYSGDGKGPDGCQDIDECASDNGGCDMHRLCVNDPGEHHCGMCQQGYATDGPTSCVDVDECATDNGGCDPHRACINREGSSSCGDCDFGYLPLGATRCIDVDECLISNGGCNPHRECLNSPGSYACGACSAGFRARGSFDCADIDECQTRNGGCDPLRQCVNADGGFSCGSCASGYTPRGATGCADIDECATNNGDCGAHRSCINSQGGHSCGACESGYPPDDSGNCTSGDTTGGGTGPCAVNNGGCRPHRICIDDGGSEASCGQCEPGWIGDDTGGCEPNSP
jgi:hypothetical protein